ncbi:MAG: MarR family EPS-associated transcriptional regulator [Hydrogenophaga sp.]
MFTPRQEDTAFRVMSLLLANPDLTQRELAERLGVSVSGLNYCLKALMEKGWVKMHNFSQSKNKFGYVYIITPSGMAEKAALTSNFLKRKLREYDALKAEIEGLQKENLSTNQMS